MRKVLWLVAVLVAVPVVGAFTPAGAGGSAGAKQVGVDLIFIGAGLVSSGPAIDDEITGAQTVTSLCSVSVAQGADGGSLLRAAKSKQCIGSYLLSAGGSSVACIDGLCSRDFGVTWRGWAVFNQAQDTDEELGPWNLRDYEASEGDLVAFRYAEHCQGASAVPAGFCP